MKLNSEFCIDRAIIAARLDYADNGIERVACAIEDLTLATEALHRQIMSACDKNMTD